MLYISNKVFSHVHLEEGLHNPPQPRQRLGQRPCSLHAQLLNVALKNYTRYKTRNSIV